MTEAEKDMAKFVYKASYIDFTNARLDISYT